jgi:hypothetical protein
MQKSGHYIKRKTQHGAPRDTRELEAMLDDMLVPPSDEDGGSDAKLSTKRMRPRSARQLPSTRPWNPLRQARNGMLPWNPRV